MNIVYGILFRLPVLKTAPQISRYRLPKVSIIFSARDESPQVRTALAGMLEQDYPDYEVIAVNDRSSDDTLSILHSFNAPHLTVLDIRELPEGWLGKNHALYTGSRAASGDYLLFTDADVHFAPGTLKAAMHCLLKHEKDHLVVFPKMLYQKWVEALFTGSFIMAFFRHFKPWKAQEPGPKHFIGVGAFNLVRRQVYERAGTHQKIAFDVLDDVHLGKIVKLAAGSQLAVCGADFISVRWIKDWSGVLKSIEKNSFAGFDYRLGLAILGTLAGLLLDVLPFAVLAFPSSPFFIWALLTAGCTAAAYLAAQKVNAYSGLAFFTHPFGALLLMFVLWRSILKVLKNGGVVWRDTFYPLEQLRAHSKI